MSPAAQQTQQDGKGASFWRSQPSDKRGAGKPPTTVKLPPRKTWLWFLLVLLANFLLMRLLLPSPKAPVTVPYTLFREEAKKHNVEAIFTRGETLTGRFKVAITYPRIEEKKESAESRPPLPKIDSARRGPPEQVILFTTTLPSFVGPGLESFLIEHGVEISAEPI